MEIPLWPQAKPAENKLKKTHNNNNTTGAEGATYVQFDGLISWHKSDCLPAIRKRRRENKLRKYYKYFI